MILNKKSGNLCPSYCFLLKQLFLSEKARVRWGGGAVREPREAIVEGRDPLGGTFFLSVFRPTFFSQNYDFQWKWSPKWTPYLILLGAPFGKIKKTEECVSTAQARTDCMWTLVLERQRPSKIRHRKHTDSRTIFSRKKLKTDENWPQKGLQMGAFISC